MAPPNRPPVRRTKAAAPPPRSDTVPEQELSVSAPGRRRVTRRPKEVEVKKSKAPLVIVLLLLVAVAGAGYWKLSQRPVVAGPPDPSIALGEKLGKLFQDGKNLVRQGKWSEAGAKFDEVLAADPNFLEGAVKTYAAAAAKEIPNQKHFDAAQLALERNEVGTCARELAQVSADTQQVVRRDALQTKQAELFKARIIEGQGLAASGGDARMRKLKALAEDLLIARPDDRDASELKSRADSALRVRVVEKVEIPKDDPALKVQTTYASGDAGGAFTAAQACAAESESCRALEGKMKDLNALLAKIESLQPPELENAQRLDRQIAGGRSSPQGKPIATRMGTAFYKKASAARIVGDWPQAMVNAFKVLDADSSHSGAQTIVNDGRERAKDLYLRCYQLSQSEPEAAKPLCTEVSAMLPAGDAYREKSDKVLKGLNSR